MRKLFFTGAIIFLFCSNAFSHEHWINLENFYPIRGEKTKIFICSGHYFPKSSTVLGERLLHDTKVISPEGKEYLYKTEEKRNHRVGEVIFESTGTYIITFSLKRPPLKEPEYWAKSIVIVEKENKDETFYKVGDGLEIVPREKISTLKKGEELPLILLYKGKPVESTLSVSVEGKKNFFLRTKKNGTAMLKIKREGRYLITAAYRGKGCSLTFCIRRLKKE